MDIKNTYVFCSLDGTLGTEEDGIPKRNREAIARFVEKGGHFGIATSRWIESAKAFCGKLPINTYSIIGNGAGIYDVESDTTLFYQSLPELAHKIYYDIAASYPDWQFVGVSLETGYHYLGQHAGEKYYPHYTKLLDETYIKFSALIPEDKRMADVILDLQAEYADLLDDIRFVQVDDTHLDILPANANKGTGIRKVADLLGVSLDNVIFIGSNYNDLEAFRVAGSSACVASTPKSLSLVPDIRLGDAMDGAVADMLNRIVRKNHLRELENMHSVNLPIDERQADQEGEDGLAFPGGKRN